MLLIGTGCSTVAELPDVDLRSPDWQVRIGQAVWTPGHGKSPIAGELTHARHAKGDSWTDFSKPPLPVVRVHRSSGRWELRRADDSRARRGGNSVRRYSAWLLLDDCLARATPPAGWVFSREPDGSRWHLHCPRTGEDLKIHLEP